MFKFIILSVTICALTQASTLSDKFGRIGGGFNALQMTPKCYTTLFITFLGSDVSRRCGGCLISGNKVVTSGNCVTTPQDGKATNIRLTIGGANLPNGQPGFGVTKISLAPGYNYLVRNSTNDLAVLTLNRTVTLNTLIHAATPYYNSTQDAFVDQTLLTCGYGYVDNDQKRPNLLQCAYLTGVAGSNCNPAFTTVGPTTTAAATTTTTTTTTTTAATTAAGAATAAPTTTAAATTTTTPVPAGPIICTQNLDDANACHGDEGSPVFVQMGTTWSLVGVVSNFPNARPNAPCLDGHNTVITQLGGFSSWITTA
ncbi:trypsin 5G1-like [Chironomus tepperi]|uniref:trypsin 5G1-like n=1 Tax=Chironomus tepperi TaxID=113505 RepID=UPI00391F65F2